MWDLDRVRRFGRGASWEERRVNVRLDCRSLRGRFIWDFICPQSLDYPINLMQEPKWKYL